jgi:hypothetical protein
MTVIKYYDLDEQRDSSRRFSSIEQQRMADIFGAINEVLTEYHHSGENGSNRIEGYFPSIMTCDCGRPVTFYDIRLKSSVISIFELNDIAKALDKLEVCLINVNTNFQLRRFSIYIGEIHGHDLIEAGAGAEREI